MDNFSTRWEYRVLQIPLGQEDVERMLNNLVPDRWEMVSCVSPHQDVLLYTFRREKLQRGGRPRQVDAGIKSASQQETSSVVTLSEPPTSVSTRKVRIRGRRKDEIEVQNPDGTISYKRVCNKEKDGGTL